MHLAHVRSLGQDVELAPCPRHRFDSDILGDVVVTVLLQEVEKHPEAEVFGFYEKICSGTSEKCTYTSGERCKDRGPTPVSGRGLACLVARRNPERIPCLGFVAENEVVPVDAGVLVFGKIHL